MQKDDLETQANVMVIFLMLFPPLMGFLSGMISYYWIGLKGWEVVSAVAAAWWATAMIRNAGVMGVIAVAIAAVIGITVGWVFF